MTTDVGMCTAALLPDPLVPTGPAVREACDAAAAAGFSELSVWGWHLPSLTDAGTIEAACGALDDRGLHVRVVEAATGWSAGSARAARAEADQLAAVAGATGASLVLAVCLESVLADEDGARERLAALADAAGAVGAGVCVEFLPWSGIPDLRSAWRLVAPLGPRVGIVVDTWHWHRQPGGPDLALLASIPPERIPYLQVSDAGPTPTGDLAAETMAARLLPGDGVVDYASLLGGLAAIGADPFVAIEMFNPAALAGRGVAGAAVAMRQAALGVLAGARGA